MQREKFKQMKRESTSSTLLKYGTLFLLLVLSMAVVACGASGSSSATAASPTPTSTVMPIHLDNNNLSPTPTVAPIFCGIWITDPSITLGSSFTVYGKFSRNVNGNPVGISGGTATLNIQWGDGTPETLTAPISSTGLIAPMVTGSGSHSGAMNKLSLITATFTSGNDTCQVGDDRSAEFTVVPAAVPKTPPTGGNNNTGGGNNNGGGGGGKKHG